MRLSTLAAVARRTGFPVVEEAGWQGRGSDFRGPVRSVILHHDAANHRVDQFNTVIRDGRSGLAGPLSQFALRRDGTIHVVAAGRANHAGVVTDAPRYGGDNSIGIEAGNNGVGEPWSRRQLDAYEALVAELCKEFRLNPLADVRGHKEVAYPLGRKIDPAGIDLNGFRAAVQRRMSGGGGGSLPSEPTPETIQEDDTMELSIRDASDRTKVDGFAFEVTPRSAIWTKAWLRVANFAGETDLRIEFLHDTGVYPDRVYTFEGDKALKEMQVTPMIRVPDYCIGVKLTYKLKTPSQNTMGNSMVVSVMGRKD